MAAFKFKQQQKQNFNKTNCEKNIKGKKNKNNQIKCKITTNQI